MVSANDVNEATPSALTGGKAFTVTGTAVAPPPSLRRRRPPSQHCPTQAFRQAVSIRRQDEHGGDARWRDMPDNRSSPRVTSGTLGELRYSLRVCSGCKWSVFTDHLGRAMINDSPLPRQGVAHVASPRWLGF